MRGTCELCNRHGVSLAPLEVCRGPHDDTELVDACHACIEEEEGVQEYAASIMNPEGGPIPLG